MWQNRGGQRPARNIRRQTRGEKGERAFNRRCTGDVRGAESCGRAFRDIFGCHIQRNQLAGGGDFEESDGRKMNELEYLVPPLELCRQIPQGAFEDSALVWARPGNIGVMVGENELWEVWDRGQLEKDEEMLPAPTLQEILDQFDILTLAAAVDGDPDHRMGEKKQYASSVGGSREYRNEHIFDAPRFCCPVPTNATAALRLWFDVKGIEL